MSFAVERDSSYFRGFLRICQVRGTDVSEALAETLRASWADGEGCDVEKVGLVWAALQQILAEHDFVGQKVGPDLRREVTHLREHCVRAFRDRGRIAAKQAQLRASEGRPLAVCYGNELRESGRPFLQLSKVERFCRAYFIFYRGDGCGRVFPDSVGLRRSDFRRSCNDCKQLARDARTHARRTLVEGVWPVLWSYEDGSYGTGWIGTCACGARFSSPIASQRRCTTCAKSHR
jgi:hypothetical protein